MAVTIRMKRGGRTHAPYYRVVVTDSRAPRDTKNLDELGVYHPCAPEPRAEIDRQRALEWLYKGATLSPTARKLFKLHGVTEAYAKGVKPEEFAPAEGEEAVSVQTVDRQKPKARRKAEEKKNKPAPAPEPEAEEAPAADAEAEAPAEEAAAEAESE